MQTCLKIRSALLIFSTTVEDQQADKSDSVPEFYLKAGSSWEKHVFHKCISAPVVKAK